MRLLLVGAASQGKWDYAVQQYGISSTCCLPEGSIEDDPAYRCINQLHLLVRTLMEQGQEVRPTVLDWLDKRPDWVVLCDEVGGGVVPIDAFDRRWREEVGRLCIAIADRADRVERLTCGIPLALKG